MELQELRNNIDRIDEQIVSLFVERMEAAKQVAEVKAQNKTSIAHPDRERELLLRVSELSPKGLDGYTRQLYGTVLDLSRAYQAKLMRAGDAELTKRIRNSIDTTPNLFPASGRVACQGVAGAYSQLACDRIFSQADIMYFKNFEGVFNAVEKGLCQYGVLPIENSSYGAVKEVYDLMRTKKCHIVRGTTLQISHTLLAKPGVRFEDVRELYSHEQAIGQCSAFLAEHPEIKVNICENTAVAARLVSESDRRDIASISSPECARLYDLSTLVESVRNEASNYTRFICIAREMEIYPGSNKISFLMTTEHRPGALQSVLAKFALLSVNVSKLESRPIPGRDFDFMFYFDLDASVYSDELVALLGDLSEGPEIFAFLGAYLEN